MKPFSTHFDEPYLKPSPRGAEQTDPSSAGTTLRPSSFLGKGVGQCPTKNSTRGPGSARCLLSIYIAPTCAGRHNYLEVQVSPSAAGSAITFLEPQLKPPLGAEQTESSSAGTTLRPFFPLKPASGAQTPLLLSRSSCLHLTKLGKKRGQRHLGRSRGAEQSDPFIRWKNSAPRLL